MDTSSGKEEPKMKEDVAWMKEVKEEGAGRSKWKLKHRQCYFWVWTRLPNLYTAWMGPLVRVAYSGLTQSVFILDRVKSSSCDCPAKIPVTVDSNASCFTCFSSGSTHPKLRSFVQLCAWSILSIVPKPPLAHYPAFIVCLATTLFKK
jgi:hypothetical protein